MKQVEYLIIIFLSLCTSSWGQGKQVKVAGTVTDEEGKALPGTQVVLVQIADTTKKFSVAAADDGHYSTEIPTGVYRLQATCIGFRLFTAEVDATQDMTVDILRKQFLKNRLALTLGYEYWPISESTLKTADIIQRSTNDYNPHRIQFSAQYQLRWGSIRAKVRQAKSTQL